MMSRTLQWAVLVAMSAIGAQWFFSAVYGHVAASIEQLARAVMGVS